jgi:alpha-tubulin suppressor-like RCC1 family protein
MDWTTFLTDAGITYYLNTPTGSTNTYNSSASSIINSSSVQLNTSVKIKGTYENKGTTTLTKTKSLTAATVQNDPGGKIQCTDSCKVTSKVVNGATVYVGGDPARMIIEGSLTNELVSPIIATSSGPSVHTLALQSDGTVWAWGQNSHGQLGNGTNDTSNLPVQVLDPTDPTGFLTGIVSVSAGYYHSLALKSDGTVWAWGYNVFGQLGNGSNEDSNVPVQVKDPTGMEVLIGIVSIKAAFWHSLALQSDGTVRAWGDNFNGELGNGTTIHSNLPVQVLQTGNGSPPLTGIASISAGGAHSLALQSDGTVWAWGYNYYGQLGNGSFGGESNMGSNLPVQVKDPAGTGVLIGIVSVSAGADHSLALHSTGTVFAWGDNEYGQLAIGNPIQNINLPRSVYMEGHFFLAGIASISAGMFHSLALTSDGMVWAWGDNQYGQLGNNTNTNSNSPVQVLDPTGTGVLTGIAVINAGAYANRALTLDGTAFAWGKNNFVLGGNASYNLPLQVPRFLTASPGTLGYEVAGPTACQTDYCPTTSTDPCAGSHSTLSVIADPTVPGSGTVTLSPGSTGAVNFIDNCTPEQMPAGATFDFLSAAGDITGTISAWKVYDHGVYRYTQYPDGTVVGPNPGPPVTVNPPKANANQLPIADAGPDQAIKLIPYTVHLDGSKSWDHEDGSVATYYWSLYSVPTGSNAVLSGSNTATPSFVANVYGDYIIQLVVTDNQGASSWPGYVTVNVLTDTAPVANAGLPKSVLLGDTVLLDGSKSSDVDNDLLTYKWSFVTRPDGSDAFIASPTSAQPSFFPDLWGSYVVQLVVNDGWLDSPPSTVNIQVTSTSHAIIEEIKALQTTIAGLPKDAFKNANMKNFLLIELNVVIATIDAGIYLPKFSKFFFELAIDQLQYVMTETDGCANSGAPDKNDRIIKCMYQNMVYPLIWDAIDNLTPLL